MEVLSPRPDYVPYLGVAISRGPVIPVFFTLSCAPDMETGLMRLAQFKSLLGPTSCGCSGMAGCCGLEFDSVDARVPMPPSLGALQLVTAVENIRGATAHLVARLRRVSTDRRRRRRMIAGHLGVMPERSRPLMWPFRPRMRNAGSFPRTPALWADIEADLKLQLAAQNDRLACRRSGARGAGRSDARRAHRGRGCGPSARDQPQHAAATPCARKARPIRRFWTPRGATWRSGISPRPPARRRDRKCPRLPRCQQLFEKLPAGGRARRLLPFARQAARSTGRRERRSDVGVITVRASDDSRPSHISSTP
jgi:hypothetical protein